MKQNFDISIITHDQMIQQIKQRMMLQVASCGHLSNSQLIFKLRSYATGLMDAADIAGIALTDEDRDDLYDYVDLLFSDRCLSRMESDQTA